MDNRPLLETLTQNFTRDALTTFLRAASGRFRPEWEDLSGLAENADFARDLIRLGTMDYEDGTRLVVLAGQLAHELTSRSGQLKQYELAKKVLKDHFYDAGIFVFHDDGGRFRFSLITAQYTGAKREFSTFRRYTYFVVPRAESNRTFIEQIGRADYSGIGSLLEAFSVEPVTREFFRDYRRIFDAAEGTITLDWSADQKRLYTQRFFNRMMFITFLERKGWLKLGGRSEYLRALFADYMENQPDKRANFHRSRLNTLFFQGLNYSYGDKLQNDPQYKILRDLIGDVPYLNGGLFEHEADDETWFFPDSITGKILAELVYRYNFTVTESTPLDVEVAVDPEMLGKIFEELVTGRHESGSYYTPKPVVAFMCREALKGYLKTAQPSEREDAVHAFVEHRDPRGLRNLESTLAALRGVTVCDLACGSGAYLLGMMHELLELRERLFAAHVPDAARTYDRKLEIIQNNLYGVDLDPFAVNIARLRLWLSLIVDYEGATPPPLPNLDFKIEAGDSLTAPNPSGGLDLGFRRQLVDDFLSVKNKYTTAHHDEKKTLLEQINKLREDIRTWSGRTITFKGFDWTIEFAEVFASGESKGGFDVILDNPPYVRADAQYKHIDDEGGRQEKIAEWQAYRKELKDSKIYKTLYEKWDMFVPFLERAYQLLCPNGQMVFIIPDAYNAAKYTRKSQEFFLQNTCVERVDFCSEIDLFDAGVNNTILHLAKIPPQTNHQPQRVRRWGEHKDHFEENAILLPSGFQISLGTQLFRLNPASDTDNDFDKKFIPLEFICYISKGMVIHADERRYQGQFTIDDVISAQRDNFHPKIFALGKDIDKWALKNIRYLELGTERAPSKFSRPTFPELHEAKEKLVAMRTPGANPKTIYDSDSLHFDASSVGFVPWWELKGIINKSINKTAKYHHQNPLGDREQREENSIKFNLKFVLAIMNSSFARGWLKGKRRSKMHVYPDDWKQLPITPISLEEQKPFVELVDKILNEYKKYGYPLPESSTQKVKAWEEKLDKLVSALYE